jgi:hypothetical protein
LPGVASFCLLLAEYSVWSVANIQTTYIKTSVVCMFYICQMEKKVKPPYQVRMSDELYAAAMAKAKSLGLSFAAYVRFLISQDTNK